MLPWLLLVVMLTIGMGVSGMAGCFWTSLVGVELNCPALPDPGIDWEVVDPGFGSTDYIQEAAYDFVNGLFVAVSANPAIASSPDGRNWTQRACPIEFAVYDVAHNGLAAPNSLWVAVGSSSGGDPSIASSSDGATWIGRNITAQPDVYNAVIYGATPGLWVAVGNSGLLKTSPDGVNWTERTSGFATSGIYNVQYGNGVYVAVGAAGKLRTSTDGINWTGRTANITGSITGIAYDGSGTWIATGGAGQWSKSTDDGATWVAQTPFTSDFLNNIEHNQQDLWVIVANDASGNIWTSPDGDTWTQRLSGFDADTATGIAYSLDGWIVTGGDNGMAVSGL